MFFGRESELKSLKGLKSRVCAGFVAVRGRRRIGKSRLIEEYKKEFSKTFFFTGLPPSEGTNRQSQRDEFVQQMVSQGFPRIVGDNWSEIFFILSKETKRGNVLIFLDEIAWMGSKDPVFLGKLKIAWDIHFSKNRNLVLVVASSISSWIDKNILNSTGFFGRVDLILTLEELSIKDCTKFWGNKSSAVSAYEKLKILGVMGGVPRYLELVDPRISAEENIRELCFLKRGFLFSEFDRIFHDLFSKRSETYRKIITSLSKNHSMNQSEICDDIGTEPNSAFSEYLKDLTEAGFISADYTWDIKSAKISKLRKYRLSDNYLRFYLKYINPNKQRILNGDFEKVSIENMIHWDTIMGLQFKNLVVHNRHELLEKLNINLGNIFFSGPFFQTKTNLRKGCQIDYLIQQKNTLYVCEIKFSKNPIGPKIINEMEEKIQSLQIPKHFSYRPVLIHVGGVTDELIEKDYFDKIVDWTELL